MMNFGSLFDLSFFTPSKNGFYGGVYSLPDILTILFFSIIVILLFRKIKFSPVIGYIVAGAIIGPFGLQLTGYNDVTKSIAEFGVVFLLFSIGLELTLERLFRMKHLIFGLGLLQFIITSLAIGGIAFLITKDGIIAFIIGPALALSSTAIILKLLSETYQKNSKTGKISLSILLFQDIAVIPIFVLIPLLGSDELNVLNIISNIGIKSLIAVMLIIIIGRFLLKPVLRIITAAQYNEIFIAATLLVILSAAWVTRQMGLSLALGAFMAGVMIAETEYQHKAHTTIEPFKGLFLGFFFITEIGMHIDISLIIDSFFLIILLTIALVATKAIIIFLLCFIFKNKFPTSINTALLIAQGGEFSFIIFELAHQNNYMDHIFFQHLSLIVGLSMALTPFLATIGKRLEEKFTISSQKRKIPVNVNQVIIAGFGRVGRTIAQILSNEDIRYVALDNNSALVAKYFEQGNPVYVGNIMNNKLLKSIEVERSTAIVLALSDKELLNKATKILSKNYPDIPLIVRALDVEHFKVLKKLGANIIVPEIQELGLQMSKHLLYIMGENLVNINKIIDSFRDQEFNLREPQ